MKKIWYLAGRHYTNTNNVNQYGKRNPKTKKLVKIFKGICNICGHKNLNFFM